MQVHQVVSENVKALAWDEGVLFIQFNKTNKAGVDVYRYEGVSHHVFEQMLHAASIGAFFHEAIKKVYMCATVQSDTSAAMGF